MECSRRHEKNVVRAHHPVTRVDGRPFDNRQNVALHTLPRNIRTMPAFTPRNLVNLIQENDSRILHPVNRDSRYLVHVNQPLLFFLNQIFERLVHLHLPLFGALPEDIRQHVLDVDIHLLHTLVRQNLE